MKANFEQASRPTYLWYKFRIDALKRSIILAHLKLNEIGPEAVAQYASERQHDGLEVSSVNGCLRTLRRVLRLAVEWDVIQRSPKVKFLPGEHRRERVITPREEALYLTAAPPLLHDVSLVLFDTGVRQKNVTVSNGRTSLGTVVGTASY